MSPISELIVVSACVYALVLLVVVFVKRPPFVVWSVWLYRLLLAAYPTPFREEYGPAMLQVFRDTARAEHRRRGLWGLLVVWLWTLMDFSVSVVRQHREQSAAVSSESVLLRDLLQRWRQFGSVAFSATAFSAWYGLHLLRLLFWRAVLVWATLTALALGTWIWSFCDLITVVPTGYADVRAGRGTTRVDMGRGFVRIIHIYEVGEPISAEQWWRDHPMPMTNDSVQVESLQAFPKPWELFRFISDFPGVFMLQDGADQKTPEILRPYREWDLIFPFFPLPVLLLWGTIRAYRRRRTVSSSAMQSA
ncbi:MAG TPA: hypothetical protein VH682_20060 [Gemmataceae bacterium]|jgi:hypothetical protein